MSYKDKCDAVRALLTEHNNTLREGSPGRFEVERFFDSLDVMGATNEERLKSLSYEAILKCLPSLGDIKPEFLAKEIAKVFRGKEDLATVDKQYVKTGKAEKMSIRELIEAFDPENTENAVGKRLAGIAKGQPFIVYSIGRVLDADVTLKLLEEVKMGYAGRDNYKLNDGTIKRVYRIGELPDSYADENPIYANRPLRPDGTCDQTSRSWAGVPANVRQLVRLIVSDAANGRVQLVSINEAHAILDMAMTPDAFSVLKDRYRKAAIRFEELVATGNLPTLKIALGIPPSKEAARPFEDGAKVSPMPRKKGFIPTPQPETYWNDFARGENYYRPSSNPGVTWDSTSRN